MNGFRFVSCAFGIQKTLLLQQYCFYADKNETFLDPYQGRSQDFWFGEGRELVWAEI